LVNQIGSKTSFLQSEAVKSKPANKKIHSMEDGSPEIR
jgi:hypothetical protein